MKRSVINLLVVITTLFVIVLVGCGSEVDNVINEQNESEENEINENVYPWKEKYKAPDYEVYSKPAKENNLAYSKVFIEAKVIEEDVFVENDEEDEEINVARVVDDESNEWMINYGDSVTLTKDNLYAFYGIYLGVSELFDDLPAMTSLRILDDEEYIPVLYGGQEIYSVYEGYTLAELQEKYIPVDDILIEEERRSELKELNDKLKYEEFKKIIDKYIETEDPTEEDNVHELNELVKNVIPYIEKADVQYDDVEDTLKVYYSGLTEINESNQLVPVIEGGSEGYSKGFVNSDWLFFDETYIKLDNDEVVKSSYKKYDIETEVLGAGKVKEYHKGYTSLEKFADNKPVTIRFKNKNTGKYLDFELSSQEQEAFEVIHKIRATKREISDYIYNWEEENM